MNRLHILLLFSIVKPSETPPAPKGKSSPTYMFSMAVPFVVKVEETVDIDEKDLLPQEPVCRSAESLKNSGVWLVPREHEGGPFMAEANDHVVAKFLGRSLPEVQRLIDTKELAINYRTERMGNTLLMMAVLRNRLDLCQLLISKSADVSARNNHNLNALQWARINGSHKEIVELLVKKGAE